MARAMLLAAVVGCVAMPATARAEDCVPLPGSTGATLEVAGRQVRVPAVNGIAVCVQSGAGLPGLPRVEQTSTARSVVLSSGGSGSEGYIAVRYAVEGSPGELQVPLPGGGDGSETCVASVGSPARADCIVKLSLDDVPEIPPEGVQEFLMRIGALIEETTSDAQERVRNLTCAISAISCA